MRAKSLFDKRHIVTTVCVVIIVLTVLVHGIDAIVGFVVAPSDASGAAEGGNVVSADASSGAKKVGLISGGGSGGSGISGGGSGGSVSVPPADSEAGAQKVGEISVGAGEVVRLGTIGMG